jgi:hypothetical protein
MSAVAWERSEWLATGLRLTYESNSGFNRRRAKDATERNQRRDFRASWYCWVSEVQAE